MLFFGKLFRDTIFIRNDTIMKCLNMYRRNFKLWLNGILFKKNYLIVFKKKNRKFKLCNAYYCILTTLSLQQENGNSLHPTTIVCITNIIYFSIFFFCFYLYYNTKTWKSAV